VGCNFHGYSRNPVWNFLYLQQREKSITINRLRVSLSRQYLLGKISVASVLCGIAMAGIAAPASARTISDVDPVVATSAGDLARARISFPSCVIIVMHQNEFGMINDCTRTIQFNIVFVPPGTSTTVTAVGRIAPRDWRVFNNAGHLISAEGSFVN